MSDAIADTTAATDVKDDKPKAKPPRKAKRSKPAAKPKPAKKRGRPKGSKNRNKLSGSNGNGNGAGTGEFLALVKKGRGYRQFHAPSAKKLSHRITSLLAAGSRIETVSAYKRIDLSFEQHVVLK